ncbi:MAG: excisionase [Hydrogenophaga sp.]|jgi:hypothetical protein|uniref:excisionase n=1 Tax=Hydrogenophaga sp. TaxID=1904254 RepID=UPI001ECA45ED|nr:excisionase [Hydrogenophaga sp.]MBA4212884.1 excisionase [Polaromonas sp.]MDZ4100656.1 excisionase [Hydrogenophaga sp.]
MSQILKYVLLKKHAEITGYSVGALEQKIDSGAWIEGIQWRKSPDGKRQINIEEYEKWVEGQPAAFSRKGKSSDANSNGRANE